ncbi:Abi-alpha family protein [Nocardioides zeae]|uniref:Abi-alpha family protein n=1 Tax=Nocardioides imazamoxiresistens TaxID=3231893 RepID=A0ABU3Q2M0_9ACTN|nr:Abi-alpha family protein [Nocardioides zeae]MDT9595320.1 Abi-alpha family protein [Nocardioides zeae]
MSRSTSSGGWGPPRTERTASTGGTGAAGAPPRALEGRTPRRPRLPVRVPSFLPAAVADRMPSALAPAVDALPGLARIAAATAYHTAEWGVGASTRTGRKMLRAMVDPAAADELSRDLNEAAAVVAGIARGVASGLPLPQAVEQLRLGLEDRGPAPVPETGGPTRRETEQERLRAKGARLLEQSRDVWHPETGHPAYERILGELAPDEARILVLLLKDGPQPSVDVRTGGPVGMVSSQLVARGLNMIGARAGLRYVDTVPQYLNNLSRLGLVWQSSESLQDLLRYQVVEAQPDVLAAMHSVKFPKVLRRSLHLTPFGVDFARMCFATEDEMGAGAFPAHLTPPTTAGERSVPRE